MIQKDKTDNFPDTVQHKNSYKFPVFSCPVSGVLPARTILTDTSTLVEFGSDGRQLKLKLNFECNSGLNVLHSYKKDGIDIFYFLLDQDKSCLHVVTRKHSHLEVVALVEKVSQVRVSDSRVRGQPEVQVRKTGCSHWDTFNLSSLSVAKRDAADGASSCDTIVAPLHVSLQERSLKMSTLKRVLAHKRKLRAQVVSSLNLESQKLDLHKSVRVIFCKYLHLRGTCLQIIKLKTSEKVEELRVVPVSAENSGLLQPEGILNLSSHKEKIIVTKMGHKPDAGTLLQYVVDGVQLHTPLPSPSLQSVINTRMQLQALKPEEGAEFVSKSSRGAMDMQWSSCEEWDALQKTLQLTEIGSGSCLRFFGCNKSPLDGVFVLAKPRKKQATLFYSEKIELDLVKFLLLSHSVVCCESSFSSSCWVGSQGQDIASDLRCIQQNRDLASKTIPQPKLFSILQQLIHRLNSFL